VTVWHIYLLHISVESIWVCMPASRSRSTTTEQNPIFIVKNKCSSWIFTWLTIRKYQLNSFPRCFALHLPSSACTCWAAVYLCFTVAAVLIQRKMTSHPAGWSGAVSSFLLSPNVHDSRGYHAEWTEAQRGRGGGGWWINRRELIEIFIFQRRKKVSFGDKVTSVRQRIYKAVQRSYTVYSP